MISVIPTPGRHQHTHSHRCTRSSCTANLRPLQYYQFDLMVGDWTSEQTSGKDQVAIL